MITLIIARRLHGVAKRGRDVCLWGSCYHSSKDLVETLQPGKDTCEKNDFGASVADKLAESRRLRCFNENNEKNHKSKKSLCKLTLDQKQPKEVPYKLYRPKAWPKKLPTDNHQFMTEFKHVMQTRQFVPAMVLYARMKEEKHIPRESVLIGLLGVCQEKDHLDLALEIFNDIIAIGSHPNISGYTALIRCYSHSGQIKEALLLIDRMKENNLELTIRSYHPVLEAVVRNKDFKSAITIIEEMQKFNVVPQSEQLTLLLEVAALSGALKDASSRDQVELKLHQTSIDILGMETNMMRKIVSAFCNMDIEKVLEEGILLESREDLPSTILDIKSSIITAMNSTYANVPTVLHQSICSPSIGNVSDPLGFDILSNRGERERSS